MHGPKERLPEGMAEEAVMTRKGRCVGSSKENIGPNAKLASVGGRKLFHDLLGAIANRKGSNKNEKGSAPEDQATLRKNSRHKRCLRTRPRSRIRAQTWGTVPHGCGSIRRGPWLPV
eukprot:GHVU01010657.1.p1 GENE.GHVU01010657.1~~GHVU01010657.1.p1  ORF type:complete len:117 (-),score=6.94 GHVU01010657.1:302-652(-)